MSDFVLKPKVIIFIPSVTIEICIQDCMYGYFNHVTLFSTHFALNQQRYGLVFLKSRPDFSILIQKT